MIILSSNLVTIYMYFYHKIAKVIRKYLAKTCQYFKYGVDSFQDSAFYNHKILVIASL